jgi:hypothetical protein
MDLLWEQVILYYQKIYKIRLEQIIKILLNHILIHLIIIGIKR